MKSATLPNKMSFEADKKPSNAHIPPHVVNESDEFAYVLYATCA